MMTLRSISIRKEELDRLWSCSSTISAPTKRSRIGR
jgi:hypothetical protein